VLDRAQDGDVIDGALHTTHLNLGTAR
jgi:hypothetical protein